LTIVVFLSDRCIIFLELKILYSINWVPFRTKKMELLRSLIWSIFIARMYVQLFVISIFLYWHMIT